MSGAERTPRERRLVPDLPRPAWILVGGACACYMAVGFVSAFLVLYLHNIRHLPLGAAGIALGAVAFAGLALSPSIGWLTDRVGSKRTLLALLAVGALGAASFIVVHTTVPAVLAGAMYGVGVAGMTGPEFALLAVLVPSTKRSAAFAMHYAAMSLGLSLGALGGGLLLSLDRPASFEIGFAFATIPFALYAVVLRGVPVPTTRPDRDSDQPTTEPHGGYRSVLADRTFLRLLAMLFSVVLFAGGQFEVAYPAYAVGVAHVTPRVVGYSFAAGSLIVVIGTLFVLRELTGYRRTRVLYLGMGFAATSWLLVLASAHVGGGTAAAVGLCIAMMIFALAEITWAPTYMPMVNDVAPENLRGRYNALVATVIGAGWIAAPLMAGFLLQAGWGDGLMLLLAAGCVLTTPIIRGIEHQIPADANVIGT